ncbi:hypothetical protein SLEP1_g35391 [Rubroshorea leprosula]|uniref:Uncharacterized protein n=1 Tax=Rubroshorea leprosula TaxID=152421 RepID=A0AAV5KNE5_9ROSI|nr:hypothetical protein SLEP1_g35391 [Rubroshorea leprosula]
MAASLQFYGVTHRPPCHLSSSSSHSLPIPNVYSLYSILMPLLICVPLLEAHPWPLLRGSERLQRLSSASPMTGQ